MLAALLLTLTLTGAPAAARGAPLSCADALELAARAGTDPRAADLAARRCGGAVGPGRPAPAGPLPTQARQTRRCVAQAVGAARLHGAALITVLRTPDPACPDLGPTLTRPVQGTPAGKRRCTSRYGMRWHPILGGRRMHTGVDLRARLGEPIPAHADGQVLRAGPRSGYGLAIEVLHPSGLTTLYAHLSRIDVAPGDVVLAGQRLGLAGSTGLSKAPHLHLEVRRGGLPVDPTPYLSAPGRLESGGAT